MDFLLNNLPLMWLILTVLFFIIEMMTSQLLSVWFAGGAAFAMILAYLGYSFNVQIIVFAIISIILIGITFPVYHKFLKNEKVSFNADALVGDTGIVLEEIDNDKNKGLIKVNGQVWSAYSDDDSIISKDTSVEILEIKGVHLIVQERR